MFQVQREKYPYRKAVLGIVVDNNQQFLIAQKLSYKENEWSFAGGGIEENETPKQAVIRELKEELGSNEFEIIGESNIPYNYEWPDHVILQQYEKTGKLYRGAEIKYFLVKFSGNREELKLQADELRLLKWVTLKDLPKHLIFPNQWQAAEAVINETMKQ